MSEQDYEQLTLFPEGSPVSPFPWLESKKERGMTVTYGRRCSELFASCARVASSVRMYLESSKLPPGRWSRIWSVLGITLSCSILKLRLSERGTEELAFSSLLPTPTTMDKLPPKSEGALLREATSTRRGSAQPCNLRDWVAVQEGQRLWPTPKATDYKGSGPRGSKAAEHDLKHGNLKGAAMYATPCAGDAQGTSGGNNGRSLRTDVCGQLNPEWVEWLMGFPAGWTE